MSEHHKNVVKIEKAFGDMEKPDEVQVLDTLYTAPVNAVVAQSLRLAGEEANKAKIENLNLKDTLSEKDKEIEQLKAQLSAQQNAQNTPVNPVTPVPINPDVVAAPETPVQNEAKEVLGVKQKPAEPLTGKTNKPAASGK